MINGMIVNKANTMEIRQIGQIVQLEGHGSPNEMDGNSLGRRGLYMIVGKKIN